jgi:ribonuclease HII
MTPRQKFDPSLIPEKPDLTHEVALWQQGFTLVAGVDEAGRGALAGPVAAGAVILPFDQPDLMSQLNGVRDSKVMTAAERDKWAEKIKAAAAAWAVGMASADEIDRIGILPATCLAASRALDNLGVTPGYILVDYLTLPNLVTPQTALVKGDARSLSIAAAAILAKTARDTVLVAFDRDFPGYGFAQHKGYATLSHRQALIGLGPCNQHRRTFAPVSDFDSLFPP